ncbi:hypothetical protein [Fibrobacter sp. UWH4]|uniref:hypothetical protein n=1 Tax=Fibrobacter sp. UWH4 TaxID=1896210 RepID=UPI000913C07B|nr:hypothetical protein [Fibrobacter sp. UWH4]SHL80527.1 hypothetical protein SAMN05720762_11513 [Fibrobacter sp. UWH4]
MRVFISGSKSISKLPKEVKSLFDSYIVTGAEILVGDCYGVDAAVQMYLDSKGYSNVIVYCSGETPRNIFVTGAKVCSYAEAAKGLTGSAFQYVKDIQMAQDCDTALMIWDGKSKGTAENIRRIKEMNKPYQEIIVNSCKVINR